MANDHEYIGDSMYGADYPPTDAMTVKTAQEEVWEQLEQARVFLEENPELIQAVAEKDPHVLILRRMDKEAADKHER